MIDVVAGILARDDDVLIASRVGDRAFEGMWEFPGGKRRCDEAPERALERELKEEIGVSISEYRHLVRIEHRYPDRHVRIDFFIVTRWSGEPAALDAQALRWVAREHLPQVQLLPADEPVVDALLRRESAD